MSVCITSVLVGTVRLGCLFVYAVASGDAFNCHPTSGVGEAGNKASLPTVSLLKVGNSLTGYR